MNGYINKYINKYLMNVMTFSSINYAVSSLHELIRWKLPAMSKKFMPILL